MKYYVGIDLLLERSSVCVMDVNGKIVREDKVASEPGALIAWFESLEGIVPGLSWPGVDLLG